MGWYETWYPIFVLVCGVGLVLGLILALRINAFIALITAAIVVSLLAPGEPSEKIVRVATAFGKVTGAIGIVIAMAAVIGRCLMESGAAGRIVQSLTQALGEKNTPAALMGSGYVLSVPVFFDTVFYLVIPLVRSLWKIKRRNYVLYLTAVVAGGAVTHSLVPPTPGPLFMADALQIDLGVMMLVGAGIGLCMSIVGLLVCYWLNRWNPIEMRAALGEATEAANQAEALQLPPLSISLLPILLPVVLISSHTIASALLGKPEQGEQIPLLLQATGLLGNPNLALLLSAGIALGIVGWYRGHSLTKLSQDVEEALVSGGLVILITAAGGAFGAMLREAGIQKSFEVLLGDPESLSGMAVLLAAAGVATLMKFAQGSGTVSMITTSTMFAAMGFAQADLGFHPVYLACAIGSGSLIGDWMNNSGFWIFAKMGGLTTEETLRTWSILLAAVGATGVLVTLLAASLFPLQ